MGAKRRANYIGLEFSTVYSERQQRTVCCDNSSFPANKEQRGQHPAATEGFLKLAPNYWLCTSLGHGYYLALPMKVDQPLQKGGILKHLFSQKTLPQFEGSVVFV